MGQYEAGLADKLLLKNDAFPTLLGRVEESEEQAVSHNFISVLTVFILCK